MPKIIITQKIPEPAKEGNWYQFGDVKIEYEPAELIDALSVMDEIEKNYKDAEIRWWKLRARLAGQKYAQPSAQSDGAYCACKDYIAKPGVVLSICGICEKPHR